MLLSRFWYVFLAVAAAAATAAALLAQAVINTRSDEALADSLNRDRAMVEAMLRLEARSRLDRMAFITVDSKLGGLLQRAQGVTDQKRLHELSAAAKDVLRGQVARMVEAARGDATPEKAAEMQPDIVFALDGDGRILAQLGPLEQNPPGASLATFPLVKRALQGYLRDDVWLYDRHVYRVAARPVMSGTEYAGAIVHGYRLEKGLTDKLAKNLGGATFAFFQGNELLGAAVPSDVKGAPQAAEIATVAAKVQSALSAGKPTDVLPLQSGGRAVLAPITGSAAAAGVGYAIARPRHVIGSPDQLFGEASQDDVKALPMPMLAGGALLLAALGLLFVYLEHDRHLKQLLDKTGEISAGARERLIITEWRGRYRALADRINQAIDKEVEKAGDRGSAPVRKKANLDELLGPTPESNVTPFFGFAGAGDEQPPARVSEDPVRSKPAAPPPKAPEPPARQRAQAPAPAAPAPPPAAVPPRAAAPATPPAAAAAASPFKPKLGATASGKAPSDFDEDAHWHEVYDEYVSTRRKCGESIDNLTFDKFSLTLRKTRDQVIEKHGAKTVRFAVHIKEGRAALKAQPVKR